MTVFSDQSIKNNLSQYVYVYEEENLINVLTKSFCDHKYLYHFKNCISLKKCLKLIRQFSILPLL